MKNKHESIDQDPVWDLLRQAPRRAASPRFVDDVVRAARLTGQEQPWWRRYALPLSLGGLTTAATAVIVAMLLANQPISTTPSEVVIAPPAESLEVLDDIVRSEALLVAAENPSRFSDAELVSLIVY